MVMDGHLSSSSVNQQQFYGHHLQQHQPFGPGLDRTRPLSISPTSTIGTRRAIVKSSGQYPNTASYQLNQHEQNIYHNSLPFHGYSLFNNSYDLSCALTANSHARPHHLYDQKQGQPQTHSLYDQQLDHLQTPPTQHQHGQVQPSTRPPISPPPGLTYKNPSPELNNNNSPHMELPTSSSFVCASPASDVVSDFGNLRVSPVQLASPASTSSEYALPASTLPVSTAWSTEPIDCDEYENSDSDDDAMPSHPNKYPVEIEYHDNKFCSYRRQGTRSGEKVKQKVVNSYDPITLEPQTSIQQNKYYQKHLVRICRCGKYQVMDGALQQGRANDCNGYEIHYSQKCRWKAYDDFKTGKRVLIRLCKCYKPN